MITDTIDDFEVEVKLKAEDDELCTIYDDESSKKVKKNLYSNAKIRSNNVKEFQSTGTMFGSVPTISLKKTISQKDVG